MSILLQEIESSQLREDIPEFRAGDTVRVHYRVIEGEKERIQVFEGLVIRKHRSDKNNKASFTVRKTVQNTGVERIFPLHSPRISRIELKRHGKVRRAKLYYMRELRGKAARIPEKIVRKPAS